MTRLRWFLVDWPVSIRALALRMQSLNFGVRLSSGFILDKVRINSLEARFIERIQYTQHVISPLGDKIDIERTEFKSISFRMYKDAIGLELIDAPRGLDLFMTKMSEVCDFEFFVKAIMLNPIKWYDFLCTATGSKLHIEHLQITDVEVLEDVRASVVLKGRKQLKLAAEKIAAGSSFSVEKLKARGGSVEQFTIMLSKQGYAIIDGRYSPDLPEKTRMALLDALRF